MKLSLTSESTAELVSVADLRTYLRFSSTDSTAEDALLASFITAARQKAENITRRSLVSQTWRLVLDDFPAWEIELPRAAPLSTVSSAVTITFVEDTTAGASTTVGSTVYTIDRDSILARVYPSYDNDWPTNYRDQEGAVTVSYITGYTSASIPVAISNWIKMVASDLYENRQSITDAQTYRIPRVYVDGMLDEYVVPR